MTKLDQMIRDALEVTTAHEKFRRSMASLTQHVKTAIDLDSDEDQLIVDVNLTNMRNSIDVLKKYDVAYASKKVQFFSLQHDYAIKSLQQNLPLLYKDKFSEYLQ